MKRKILCLTVVVVVFMFVGILPALAEEEPPPAVPGIVEGTGTYFEVTDSEYLNVTVESSAPVHLMLESVPQMVVMHLEAAEGAASTEIILTGFPPSTTFYKYEDDYHNEVPFTTDAYGSYSYTQDLVQSHLVFIQTNPSTYFIKDDATGGDCKDIGTWDAASKTCTMTQNVIQSIQIDNDNVTLDGGGHTVTGTGYGVYLPGRTGSTIKNLNVQAFTSGIYLYNSSNNTLTGNTASNNYNGIILSISSGNTLTGNTASSNNYYYGISLENSSGNTLTGNTASNNYYGINLTNSSTNTLTGNDASNNTMNGIFLYNSSTNTLTGNDASYNYSGIYLYNNSGTNTLTGNTASNNTYYGILLNYKSSTNTLTGNDASNNYYGIIVGYSNNNEIYNNNFIDNTVQAIVSGSGNVFHFDPPTGGNFWSDHTSPDTDGDGFVDTPYVFTGGQDDFPWVVQDGWRTPAYMIEQLESQVLELNLHQGIENCLDAKLEAVQQALDDINEHNDVAAINALGAFINAVEAQRGIKIPEQEADALIAAAQAIIAALES